MITVREKRVLASLLSAACLSTLSLASVVEWRVADGGNGHLYDVVRSETRLTWEDARAHASALGGHLATLTSAAEDQFVFALVASRPEAWQGNTFGGPWLGAFQPSPTGTAPDQGWVWVTGEAWSYTNWSSGEPGDQGWMGGVESYLQYRDSGGGWNDFTNDGNSTFSFVIEYPVPAPGAVLLLGVAGCSGFRRRRAASGGSPSRSECGARRQLPLKTAALSAATLVSFAAPQAAYAEIYVPQASEEVARYHVEGLYDMVGLGTWNGEPVSETNQPSPWQRRLAADVNLYRDLHDSRVLWIAINGIVTTQGANWWGSPAQDVQLTGIALSMRSGGSAVSAQGYSGEFALDGQRVLTESGSMPIESTPGYHLVGGGGITRVQCDSGTDYGLTSFSWVSGLRVLTGGAVFRLTLDTDVVAIDWRSTGLTARYGVDHQFVEGVLVPAPGVAGCVALFGALRARRRRP